MFIGNCFSNKSNLDIYMSNESPLKKRNFYKETTTKKKSGDNFNNINVSNLLIDALRNFSVKYELEDKIILKDYKFVISFDDLIAILSYCLKSQKKLYEIEQEDSSIILNLINSFINNISNYIYSYEEVEKINPLSKNTNKIKSPSNKENINFNSNKINTNNKKPICIIKSSSCWANIRKTKIIQKQKKEKLKNNYHTNLKINKNTNNTKNIKINLSKNENNNTNETDEKNYTKTFFKRKKYKNLSAIFSPVKNPQNKSSIIKVMKVRNNKSAEKRRIKSQYNDYFKNSQKKFSKNNKSMEKRNNNKSDDKNESKNISIYSACEYIKSSSFLLKNKNKDFNNESKIENKSSFNSNNSINLINNKDKKVVYYNENMNLGIKKKIIRGSMPRPSNLANKLLAKGIQFITDFNGLKEEEQRKSLIKYH